MGKNPRKTRGEYRPIFEALFTGKDYRALAPDAKLVLLTLKGLCGAMGIKVWPALAESLAELTGMPTPRVRSALVMLVSAAWIEVEDGLVWVVRGLEFEPQISHGEKHRAWFKTGIDSLPRSPIVERMCRHYAALFDYTPSIPHRMAIDSISQTHTIPAAALSPATSPSLSPAASLSPATASSHTATTLADDVRLLTMAANAGLDQKFPRRNPFLANSGPSAACAEAIRTAGVDVDYAAAVIFAYASTMTRDAPPNTLKYFSQHVVESWQRDQARRDAASYRPSAQAAAPELDQMRSFAIRYAREGSAEWQAYCDDRAIAWQAAA